MTNLASYAAGSRYPPPAALNKDQFHSRTALCFPSGVHKVTNNTTESEKPQKSRETNPKNKKSRATTKHKRIVNAKQFKKSDIHPEVSS